MNVTARRLLSDRRLQIDDLNVSSNWRRGGGGRERGDNNNKKCAFFLTAVLQLPPVHPADSISGSFTHVTRFSRVYILLFIDIHT